MILLNAAVPPDLPSSSQVELSFLVFGDLGNCDPGPGSWLLQVKMLVLSHLTETVLSSMGSARRRTPKHSAPKHPPFQQHLA
jgi:hypothetical protein